MRPHEKNITLDLLDRIAREEVRVPSNVHFSMRYWRINNIDWYKESFGVEVPPECNTVCCYWGTARLIVDPELRDMDGPSFEWREQSDRHAAYGRLFNCRKFTKEQAFFWATRILENGVVDLCDMTLEGYDPETRPVSNVMFRNSVLSKWKLERARFRGCDFTRAILSECDFSDRADPSQPAQTTFIECNMDGCSVLAGEIGVSLLFSGCTGSVVICSEGKTFTARLQGDNHSIVASNGEFYEEKWETFR